VDNIEDAVAHYEAEHDGVLYVDRREDNLEILEQVKRVCEERNVGMVVKQMESGDYVYHGPEQSVAIEHKGIDDAVSSSMDDRIYTQCDRMAQEFDRAFLFIVGDTDNLSTRHRNIGYGQAYGQIKGAVPQILATMNIPVLWVRTESLFADIGIRALLDAGNHGLEDNEKLLISPGTSTDPRMGMLMTFDGLGSSQAENVLETFDWDIQAVANAEYSELRDVDGVGGVTAKKIWNTFRTTEDGPGMDPKHDNHPMWTFLDTDGVGGSTLREIWKETNGLQEDPYRYVREEIDPGATRRGYMFDAIQEAHAELGIDMERPAD
jgi:ERCC4-type nuclease